MRTKYLLPCSCGRKIPVEAIQAGQTVRCTCGAELEIPTMKAVTSLEPAEPASTARKGRSTSTWGAREGRILLAAVITASALGLAAYLQWTQPRLADVQSLSPLQTWAAWQELRLGADRRLPPEAEIFYDALRANRHWLKLALGVATVGLLLLGIFWLAPDRR